MSITIGNPKVLRCFASISLARSTHVIYMVSPLAPPACPLLLGYRWLKKFAIRTLYIFLRRRYLLATKNL